MRLSGIQIEDALSTYEATFLRISTRQLRPSQLVFSSTELGPNPTRVMLQSIYSMAIAIVATLIGAPVMLVAVFLIRLTSPGPAFFRQQRVGRNDRPFTVYKFRSMYRRRRSPERRRMGAARRPSRDSQGRHVHGRSAARASRELEQRITYYRQRHCMKPGITGWAQINHKYGDTIEDTIIKWNTTPTTSRTWRPRWTPTSCSTPPR
jgi:lipopolysaccharide/colanic/teichoic acid biosynthesis glycosyltransferase